MPDDWRRSIPKSPLDLSAILIKNVCMEATRTHVLITLHAKMVLQILDIQPSLREYPCVNAADSSGTIDTAL
jgi:hypothetical protein